MESTRLALLEEYGMQLARVVYYRGKSPTSAVEGRLREIRSALLKHHGNGRDDSLSVMFESLDHLYRVVMMRPPSRPFSVQACAGAEVEYYRVVIDEDGDIHHDSGKLTNQVSAVETAESWYYLVAGLGLTVTLLAVLESGQIIKCGARKVT